MSDVTPAPEEATPLVEVPETPAAPAAETPEATTVSTEEPEITEADIQDLIDRILVEPSTENKEEPVPTSPQFAGEKDPLTDTIEQLDKLVDQTVVLEQEKGEAVAKVATLEEEVNDLRSKVDFVDTAYERISNAIGTELAEKIAKGELTEIPMYLMPGKMDAVLSDKTLGPLVQARLEGRDINIPKFLSEIVASKKAALPNITSAPEPKPTVAAPKESLMAEVSRLSNLGF